MSVHAMKWVPLTALFAWAASAGYAQPAAPLPAGEARDALLQAGQATGTENPAEAGASYARASGPVPVPLPVIQPEAEKPQSAALPPQAGLASQTRVTPEVISSQTAPVSEAGGWKVQLGTFSIPGNAEKLWDRLSVRPELAGRARQVVPSGRFVVLYAGGYPSRTAAQAACRALRQARQDCLVAGG